MCLYEANIKCVQFKSESVTDLEKTQRMRIDVKEKLLLYLVTLQNKTAIL